MPPKDAIYIKSVQRMHFQLSLPICLLYLLHKHFFEELAVQTPITAWLASRIAHIAHSQIVIA